MKLALIFTLSLLSLASFAEIPSPGTFIPFLQVSIKENQIKEKNGKLESMKNFLVEQGRIQNWDIATPALKLTESNGNEVVAEITSKENLPCNVEKYNAFYNDHSGAGLSIELFDYSHASPMCLRPEYNTLIVFKEYAYGHALVGTLKASGDHEAVYHTM